jgi:hypothetical protein
MGPEIKNDFADEDQEEFAGLGIPVSGHYPQHRTTPAVQVRHFSPALKCESIEETAPKDNHAFLVSKRKAIEAEPLQPPPV